VTKANHHANDAHQLEGNAMGIKWKQPGVGISSLLHIRMLLQAPSQTPLDLGATNYELRALQHFQTRTISALSASFDCDFWNTVVLQVSDTQAPVRSAIIAFSGLHESFERGTAIRIQFITQMRINYLPSNSTTKLFARQHSGWT